MTPRPNILLVLTDRQHEAPVYESAELAEFRREHLRYDLTLDPTEEHNLAHPSYADDRSRELQHTMLGLLIEQLDAKRLTPSAGETPGYLPPAVP